MSYRGMGGFGRAGDLMVVARQRRRRRAGDLNDIFVDDPGDESAGLDLSSTPDFSDVTGGSSTIDTDQFSTMAAGLPSLSGIGSALAPFFGGGNPLAGLAGSAAAAGAASGAGKLAKRIAKKFLGVGGHHRRMNPGNFKALHRAMRRLSSFEHAAKRVYKFVHPGAHKSGFKFRRRRRKR